MISMFSLVRLGCRNLEDIAVQEIDMKLARCSQVWESFEKHKAL